MKMSQLENILCDIDGLIGAALEAGDNENARALVEEFGEWFIEYDANEDIEVTCLEVLSEQWYTIMKSEWQSSFFLYF